MASRKVAIKSDPKGGPSMKRLGGRKVYHRPDPIPTGEMLTDICGKRWKLGKSVGVGGFGEIYLASDEIAKPVTDKANYVVKIEPHGNGPLFVEISVYIRIAKLEMINEWKKLKKMESLGMPWYVTSGLYDKYRFMVIPRFGQDLHKILTEKPGKRFHIKTVQAIAVQVIDTLEYIHSKDYIHGDIKASNLLLGGTGTGTALKKHFEQIYLLDYGLASKYVNSNRIHVPHSPDLRKAHTGTLEYTSRDAHIGAFSRRGDLEILGYNLLEWTCGKLPWTADDRAENVAKQKNAFMAQIKSNGSLRRIYPTFVDSAGLDILESFIRYVSKLEFEEEPNYKLCKDLLIKGMAKSNLLYLDEVAGTPSLKSEGSGSKLKWISSPSDAPDGRLAPVDVPKKIRISDDEKDVPKRPTRQTTKVNFNWTRVLSSDPEKTVRSVNGSSTKDRTPPPTKSPPIVNPTPAMLQILHKKRENMSTPVSVNRSTTKDRTPPSTKSPPIVNPTPAMLQILHKRRENMSTPVVVVGPNTHPNTRGADEVYAGPSARRGHVRKMASSLINPTPAMLEVIAKSSSKCQ